MAKANSSKNKPNQRQASAGRAGRGLNRLKASDEWQERIEEVHKLRQQLPFVAAEHPNGRGWWSLPCTGEYSGGCDAGVAAAHAYLKYLREIPDTYGGGGTLQHIALDMLGGRRTNVSLRGQAVGFFSTLDYYLKQVAKLDSGFDLVSFEVLKRRVSKGVANTKADDQRRYRAENKVARSAAAKRGWYTRRAKQEPMHA